MIPIRRIFALTLLLAFSVARAESPDKLPKPTSYVSDFAGVMDAESKQSVEALCTDLDRQAHAQIAVVTVNSLDGMSIEDYSTALYDKWKIGPKATDKGILMLFAVKDHKRRIEVGPGMQGILNDAKVGDIGRSMVPQLQAGQYGPAILGGVQQLANDIAADAGVTLSAPEQPSAVYAPPAPHRNPVFGILKLIFFIIIFLVVLRGGGGWGILGLLLGSGLGRGGGGGGGFGGGGGGFGGGDGGGGGGFGGFGGGGSDGGGASGDW